MFSRWTSTPSGAVRCTGAKFQTARTPPSTRAFKHPCAAEAGTVRMPIWIFYFWQKAGRAWMSSTGRPSTAEPMSALLLSNAATMFSP